MRAVKCPVCNGEGAIPTENETRTHKPCHGCNGKGWVEVGGKEVIHEYIPQTPPPHEYVPSWPYYPPMWRTYTWTTGGTGDTKC